MSKYLMALDQGTTSSRCIIFSRGGEVLAAASRELPQIFPQSGWVEHDPGMIRATQIGAAAEALAKLGCTWREIAAIGITNQRETTIVWERDSGRPICNAIVWQCRRTAEDCERLIQMGLGDKIREKTGLLPDPYFSATKLRYILDHTEGARERAARGELCFGTVDTWLLYSLSGGKIFATDHSNASRTMLYNLRAGDWDDELLDLFEIPRAMLPEIRPSASLFGYTDPDVLGARIPITGVAGDQQAALFGQGCHAAGSLKNTYGTGGFLLMNTGETPIFDESGLLTTVAWQIGDQRTYALEGSVFVCGSAVQWLRDGLGIIKSAAETEAIARSVSDTGGLYLVPAFTGLGAPHWDPFARGVLIGITRATGRAEIVRATLESMAYQAADVIRLMEGAIGRSIPELRVDGGAAANDFLLAFQSDLLGIDVVRPACIESTALGAAALAGIGVGLYSGTEEVSRLLGEAHRFSPSLTDEKRTALLDGWHRAVKRSLAWQK
jgi:glycerol kinase